MYVNGLLYNVSPSNYQVIEIKTFLFFTFPGKNRKKKPNFSYHPQSDQVAMQLNHWHWGIAKLIPITKPDPLSLKLQNLLRCVFGLWSSPID